MPDVAPSQVENDEETIENEHEDDDTQAVTGDTSKKRAKQPVQVTREAGKSLLPFTRVQKIIKADKVRWKPCMLELTLNSLDSTTGHSDYCKGRDISYINRN